MRKAALLDWVDDQRDIREGEKNILGKLARYAGADACAWAKVETLAYEANTSVRTVQYRLRKLEEAGKIAATGRFYRLGTRSIPIYQIAPDEVAQTLPETTVAAAGKVGASEAVMGADSAPMDGAAGAPDLHPYGCNSLHPHKEPKRTQSSEANASSERARAALARAMRVGFDEGLATYPDSGRGVTSEPEAWALWPAEATEAGGPAVLAACIAAYAADPSLKRRDFGAPSLQRFLREKRWKNWLPRAAIATSSPALTVWPGPPEIRDQLVALQGEDFARAWLDHGGWDGTAIVARTRIAATTLRQVLRGTDIQVLDPVKAGVG